MAKAEASLLNEQQTEQIEQIVIKYRINDTHLGENANEILEAISSKNIPKILSILSVAERINQAKELFYKTTQEILMTQLMLGDGIELCCNLQKKVNILIKMPFLPTNNLKSCKKELTQKQAECQLVYNDLDCTIKKLLYIRNVNDFLVEYMCNMLKFADTVINILNKAMIALDAITDTDHNKYDIVIRQIGMVTKEFISDSTYKEYGKKTASKDVVSQ